MIISTNNYLTHLDGTYDWTPERVVRAWEQAHKDLRSILMWGPYPKSVVFVVGAPGAGKSYWISQNRKRGFLYFEACLDLPYKRKNLLNIVRELDDSPVRLVWVRAPLDVCLQRNRERTADRRVPEHVVRKMHSMLERYPPSERESFDIFSAE